jgi:hypothetical protein
MCSSSIAMVMAFFTGVDRFVKADEDVVIEDCTCELSSWKNFEISCCGVMEREREENFDRRIEMR